MRLLTAIVDWSLRNRPVVLVATILFVLFGARAALRLPMDAVPDVTNVQVQIITSSAALSPVEIEQYVTIPVERAMAGMPQLSEVRSISKYGISVVTAVFGEDTDIYFARQMVAERMREVEAVVPPEYGHPVMGPISSALGEVYQFVLRGQGHSLMELEETLDWYIGPQLRMVPGVVDVNSLGGENKEYQVVLDPQRLQAAGLSVREVSGALALANGNAGGGYIEHNREQIVIGTRGLVRSLEDLRTVVLGATRDGVPVTIAQVGDVRFGPRLRRGAASMDGKGEVAVGLALMLIGENSRTVTEAVKARVEALRGTLPAGMTIEPFYDRSLLVDRTIRTAAENLLEGAALVVVVLFLLLGDVRAGLIVATTIPLSMLFAVVLMNATGQSGNLMSLGAIDFGLIVDGAVIIVENAVRRLAEARRRSVQDDGGGGGAELSPEERLAVVREATMEVRGATVFGEAILLIVYLPILALGGIEGKLFLPMARTVLYALCGAFVLSLTLVPVLASYFLRPAEKERETWILRKAHGAYLPLLRRALLHPLRTLGIGALLIAGAAALSTRLGAEFVPQLDEGDLLVEANRLPGISLGESIATSRRMEVALLQIPEVRHVVSKTGLPELATDNMGIEQTDVYIQLKERRDWRPGLSKERLSSEVAAAVREAVPEVAGAVSQPIQMRTNELIAGVRADVAAMIYGPDLKTLGALGQRVADALDGIPGVVDRRIEQTAGLSYLRIHPDRARLARYGLTVADVNQLAETIAVGSHAGTIFEGERRFDLVIKVAAPYDGTLTVLRSLPLKSRTGQMVPLGDVAQVELERGPALVNRDQQSRRLIVQFNVRGRDLVSVVEEARRAVGRLALPPGYRIEWGGQFQNYLEARARLAVVVPMALGLILFLLWLAFRALRPALLIFLNIPFAIIGGVVSLWLRGLPFSISAGVGFIALFGVAVLNGLVLVTFSRRLEGEGKSAADAIREAAELRLRPVLMTALVASLGFLPMALSRSPGSEVQRPLATVVIGGLVTATALTLLLLPAVYGMRLRLRRRP